MEKEKLTEKEKNMFKHGLSDDHKIMAGLKIVFGIAWGSLLAFFVWNIVCKIQNKTISIYDFGEMLIFANSVWGRGI